MSTVEYKQFIGKESFNMSCELLSVFRGSLGGLNYECNSDLSLMRCMLIFILTLSWVGVKGVYMFKDA